MKNSCLEQFAPICAIATNQQAAKALAPLARDPHIRLWLPETLESSESDNHYRTSLKEHLSEQWNQNEAFIFCLAAGAVVRLIAPLLKDKATDPAAIVIDARGDYVISLCSGHQGKADLLARVVAEQIDAIPIITGASNSLSLPAMDILGFTYGWRKGEGDWTGMMAALAKQETVQVIQEAGSLLWQDHLPANHPFQFGFNEPQQSAPQARIWISPTKRKIAPQSDFPKVQWHPRVLWLGIGCERNTSGELIARAIEETCKMYHLAVGAIAGIASIDLKANEAGIIEVCQRHNLSFRTFTAEQLNAVEVPTPSAVVEREVGTSSVAEAAAILAGDNLLVTKQIFKSAELGAVTVAISQAEREYIGHTGKLYLVGIGPGDLDQITPAAKTAIVAADVVIGYNLYIDLIAALKRPDQIVEASPITQEQQRAKRAIELAQWGLTVAVVSSGDCGIYGMAGLVLEELQNAGWDGKMPHVGIFPGISALQSAASRVGAPLMHDFCAISLSDLLTPWSMIQKRLQAAASGDFITTLYNPRSQTRTQQIVTAREIFLEHRQPDTPVAIVHGAYRKDERVILTTLENMLEQPIDMLTTVIIGNTTTRNHAEWMITPRGYLGFEPQEQSS